MTNPLARMRQTRQNADAPFSTTSDAELCMIEAELAAEERIANYHVPADESVLGQVQARCKQNDLTPAWVVVDGVE